MIFCLEQERGCRESKSVCLPSVLYGMDNATFYAEDEDGDRALPKPDKENKYHVVGSCMGTRWYWLHQE